ncbi:MAG: Crp/Fnr family transcriptional regulator [Candidatus Marinimicrobia bacterium]|nr:Crp/Fnr family transcriptional regulator [Candidatus Neomarinimicrobiota bacterium]MDP6593596.1 Crp/Fnr family transcriptional regulator [Candidatus Neomarinimicrobiota bacterium]
MLKTVDRVKTDSRYKKGQIVFNEGNPVFGLYCVKEGKAKVYQMTPDGKRQILRIAGSGNTLGLRSLLAEQPYSTTAEVLEDSTLCFIDRRTLYSLISDVGDMTWKILRDLSRELIESEKRTTEMARFSVRERTAGMLLLLKEKFGRARGGGIELNILLSRQDLADLAGTSTESLVRTLTDFKNEGFVFSQGKKIVLLDAPGLARLAGVED